MRKFQRDILKQLPRGWAIEHRSGRHPRIVGPDGDRYILSSSPKNAHYAVLNTLTTLRKAGVVVGPGASG
jgi:hypothetical protein